MNAHAISVYVCMLTVTRIIDALSGLQQCDSIILTQGRLVVEAMDIQCRYERLAGYLTRGRSGRVLGTLSSAESTGTVPGARWCCCEATLVT